MENRLNVLDKETLRLIEYSNAKPNITIRKHIEDLLSVLDLLVELGYIKDEKTYKLVEKACIYHDLGKLNCEFQKRIRNTKLKFKDDREVPHNVLSIYFIDKDKFNNKDDYLKVAHSVLNHHNYCNTYEELRENKELIQKLIAEFKTYNITRSTISRLTQIVEDNEAIKIKGYLHKCDYNASANSIAEYKNDFLDRGLNNLLTEWRNKDKCASWNRLQEFCIENRNENIIAIAQTGMGKTEAGLLWISNNKGFFILPIRTAINAIYDRVRKQIIKSDNITNKLSILHSSSLEYYMRNLTNSEREEFDLIDYHNIGNRLAIPLNISTMDQLFDFIYKYQGYELKLTTLSYSKIVIDEIQAYGPDVLAYLICGLEKIVELGGKIAILTATLPPFIKDLLNKNICFKESESEFTNNIIRHNLKIVDKVINAKDIKEKYNENKVLNKSNKILVVCNTVKKAQELYEELKNELEDEEVKILHSKFIKKERVQKELDIIDFGKTNDENGNIDKKNGIWIATSIVEASLDIDFDYLFTELEDLNSLFQRLGRCNRKGKKNNSYYNCFVYTNIEESNFINGNKGFIDKRLFDLSKEAIKSIDGQISEDKKIKLINEYLTTENLRGSDYMRTYNDVYDYIRRIPPYKFDIKEVDLRNILSEDIIPSPIYEIFLSEIRKIEKKLLDSNTTLKDRIKLKDELKKYTVSIHPNDIRRYKRALNDGKAILYKKVSLSKYKNDYINVIECNYDSAGYKRKDYDQVRKPEIC